MQDGGCPSAEKETPFVEVLGGHLQEGSPSLQFLALSELGTSSWPQVQNTCLRQLAKDVGEITILR